MDNAILKKRLGTFKSSKGSLARISDDVIIDVLKAWECWEGSTKKFSSEIGISFAQLGVIIKKGKKLIKNGVVSDSEFKQIAVQEPSETSEVECKGGIVLKWETGKTIRFPQVDQLVEFLKKVA